MLNRSYNRNLLSEKSSHYIINYQIENNSRLFRMEAYHKKYDNLMKYDTLYAINSNAYNNDGFGYARGIDLFFRDNRSIKNGNFRITYSYIDSKRNYRDNDRLCIPDFISKHNASIDYKYYFDKLSSFIFATYHFATGRPYFNPNKNTLAQQYTKPYQNLSIGWFYNNEIFDKFITLYFQVNNVFGFKNIYGYRYAATPDENGFFEEIPILPVSRRMIVAGIYLSLQNIPEFN